MTKQELLEILKENKDLIEKNNFENFYNKIDKKDRHYFTDLFLKSEIDPLKYMEGIPSRYAYSLDNLKYIIIPNNIKYIGNQAFEYCKNLKNVKFEENSQLKSINPETFYHCDNLTNITIPSSVTSISYATFYSCSSLTSIKIPSSVTSIGHGAFESCSNLTNISLPSSVTNIGIFAFEECNKLKDIYYEGSEEDWENIDIVKKGNKILNKAKIYYNSKI